MADTSAFTVASTRIALTLLCLTLLIFTRQTLASDSQHMVPLTIKERVHQADIVLEGEVLSQKSFWDAQHENIYTSSIIKVYKLFKGDMQAEQVEVITEGGTVGMQKHVFSTALNLRAGQQGMFFLKRQQAVQRTPAEGLYSTNAYGSQQGFVQYNLKTRAARGVFDAYSNVEQLYKAVSAETNKPFRTISENEILQAPPVQERKQQEQGAQLVPVITSFSPTVASAGTGTILTINGSGFGNSRGNGSVEFRNADDGGQTYVKPLRKEYISWTDRQIRMYIPSITQDGGTAGSGPIRVTASDGSTFVSATSLTLEFAYSNIDLNDTSFKPILIDQSGNGGYAIRFAPSMENQQAAKEGFRRAMNSWVCASEVNWEIGAPTTKDAAADDDMVIIRFAPTSTVGAGVLARTVSRYAGCANGVDTLFWVTEFDMEINSNIRWQYGPAGPGDGEFDFETVVLHELGHAHQLGHVNLSRAVMFYAIEQRQLVRDLSPIDIKGADLVMATSTENDGTLGDYDCRETPSPMVPSLEGECNLAPEIYTLEADFTSENTVTISWTTRNELTVDNFIVQRSASGTTGSTWEDIGMVDAKGPSATQDLSYVFEDNSPLPDVSFYRLKVVYNDASFSFSPRVRVINPASLRDLRLYPNPFTSSEEGRLQLLYIVNRTTTMEVEIYSMQGQLVRDFDLQLTDTNVAIELDLSGIASGMYILKWQEGTRGGQQRILKL
ncbi:IPT/TIG domain-containing protein [Pontibacter oryzae]|uniref:T9SS C-terminal target domain-containing protein n=1 Tax=Pontibacter oryzae TaxID=2304593 RepID=A0A399S6U8_9BACT|nr:IPT/TIG domain-containing protein [Pontibacter oryzae]RIJ37537.1 T9SS C-terminal target domain-containing protein [Pontibacter oryzae]